MITRQLRSSDSENRLFSSGILPIVAKALVVSCNNSGAKLALSDKYQIGSSEIKEDRNIEQIHMVLIGTQFLRIHQNNINRYKTRSQDL